MKMRGLVGMALVAGAMGALGCTNPETETPTVDPQALERNLIETKDRLTALETEVGFVKPKLDYLEIPVALDVADDGALAAKVAAYRHSIAAAKSAMRSAATAAWTRTAR